VSVSALADRSTATARLRALVWRHPQWWIFFVAAACWVGVALGDLFGGISATGSGVHDHLATPENSGGGMGVSGAVVMTVAMMAPLAAPAARYVSLTSFWSRRHRAQVLFLGGYLGAWIALGALTASGVAIVANEIGRAAAIVVFFGAAATWQFTWVKRRALRRCNRTMAIAPKGWRANWDCIRFGAISASSCVVTCWAFMASVAAAVHALEVMAVVFGLQLHERITRRYRPSISALILVVVAAWSLTFAAP
jgi:predicted metal-binding membrane protein